MLARLHFGLRGCVGEGTQDTDRVEFKQTAAERGRCSRSGHLCIVWCAFQCCLRSPSRPWWLPLFQPRLEQTSMTGSVTITSLFSFWLQCLVSGARKTVRVCRSLTSHVTHFPCFHVWHYFIIIFLN